MKTKSTATLAEPPPATAATPHSHTGLKVEPYLYFAGNCEEAIAFYRDTVGAEVTMMMRYKDSPEPPPPGTLPPGSENKIMYANLRMGNSFVMASDDPSLSQSQFEGFSLSLVVPTDAEAQRLFNALSAGGQVKMPLQKTFFASSFGMLADRFGVGWMVIVMAPGNNGSG